MQEWLLHSHTFPQCQEGKTSLDEECMMFPLIYPLLEANGTEMLT